MHVPPAMRTLQPTSPGLQARIARFGENILKLNDGAECSPCRGSKNEHEQPGSAQVCVHDRGMCPVIKVLVSPLEGSLSSQAPCFFISCKGGMVQATTVLQACCCAFWKGGEGGQHGMHLGDATVHLLHNRADNVAANADPEGFRCPVR